MKLTSTKTCMCLFCALTGLLVMGICPGGASCSSLDSQADLWHATGQESCGYSPVSCESFLSFGCAATEHSNHECCRHCSDSHFHFGCGGGLILCNHTRSITFTTFTWIGAVTNNAVLAQGALSPQAPGISNAALPLLRTVILLT